MPQRHDPVPRPAVIAAVLHPGERPRVAAAGEGCFDVVHRDSVPETIRLLRERAVEAVLVSVHQCPPAQVPAVGHLVRDFPTVPTVALLSAHDAASAEMLLQLGATGIRQVVDVTTAAGWQRLRHLVGRPSSRAAARIQAGVFEALEPLPPDARLFLEVLIQRAGEISTVRRLAEELRIRPSTLMSRFVRAGLPSPKSYLAMVRLLYAADLFENPGLSVSDVAYRLEFSSPQSFGRHVRTMLGVNTTEFRRRLAFPAALARFLEQAVTPFREVWSTFHPLMAGRGIGGHRSVPASRAG